MKQIKHGAILLTVALLIGMVGFSCEKDKNNDPAASTVAGTWAFDGASFDIQVNNLVANALLQASLAALTIPADASQTIAFNADGTLSSSYVGHNTTGTYTVEGNKINITEGTQTFAIQFAAKGTDGLTLTYDVNDFPLVGSYIQPILSSLATAYPDLQVTKMLVNTAWKRV